MLYCPEELFSCVCPQVLLTWARSPVSSTVSSRASPPSQRAASPALGCTTRPHSPTPRPSPRACRWAAPTTTPTFHLRTRAPPKARADPSRPAAHHISTMALHPARTSSPWFPAGIVRPPGWSRLALAPPRAPPWWTLTCPARRREGWTATGATVTPRPFSTPEAAWMKQCGGHIEEKKPKRWRLEVNWCHGLKAQNLFFFIEKGIFELSSAISSFCLEIKVEI